MEWKLPKLPYVFQFRQSELGEKALPRPNTCDILVKSKVMFSGGVDAIWPS